MISEPARALRRDGYGWVGRTPPTSAGRTVVVVGDGAVGLLGVGLRRSRWARADHRDGRQVTATARREFGHGQITERGEEGVERIKQLTKGVGATGPRARGTQESMMQAIKATRPRRLRGLRRCATWGVSRRAALFFGVHLHGGPALVRQYLPKLIDFALTAPSIQGRCSTWRRPVVSCVRATARWTSVGD